MELFKLVGSIFIDDTSAKKALKDTENQAQSVGDKFGAMGGKMTQAGTVMTGAVALVGGSLIKMASDSEGANVKLQNQLGLSAKEAEKFGQIGKNLYKGAFGESLGEVNDALVKTKQNLGEMNDEDLEKLTGHAMQLADSFNQDVGEATKTAGVMMKNFGISGEHAMDLMTVGFQKGGVGAEELLESMNEYAPQFASMGMSADDMMNIFIKGSEAGAFSLDKVGDAVKEFNVRAGDGSKTTAEGFKALGMDAEEMGAKIAQGGDVGKQAFDATIIALAGMKDPMERNTAGVALFGTQWEDLQGDVITAMTTTGDELGKVDGATQKLRDNVDKTFSAQFTSALRTAQASLEPLALKLLEVATDVLPKLIAVVTTVTDFFTNMPTPIQNLILIIGGVIAVIAPLLVGFGMIASAIGAIIPIVTMVVGWFGTMSVGAGLLGGAMAFLTSPITLVIGAIIALIAIGVLLYKNWDEVSAFAKKVWGGIKDFFSATMNFLGDLFSKVWDGIKVATEFVFNGIKLYFTTIFNIYKTIFTTAFDIIKNVVTAVWDGIKIATEFIWNAIKTYLTNAFEFYKNLFTTVWNALKTTITTVWDAIKNATTAVWDGIKTILTNAFNFYKNLFTTVWDFFKNTITNGWNAIKSVTETVWNAIKGFISTITNGIKSIIETIWNTIKNVISTAINNIKSNIETIWNAIKSVTSTVFNAISSTISSIWNGIKSTVSTVVNGIKSSITGVWDSIKSTTQTVFNAIKGFITKPIEDAKNTVKTAIDAIKGFFTNLKIPEIKIPKIKLPHFGVSGNFSLNPPSIPSFSVDWYKTGGIATGDSIVGIGEAGNEAVLPLEGQYLKPWATEMAKQLVNVGGGSGSGYNTANITIELDGKTLAKALGQPLTDVIKAKAGIK